MPRLRVIDDEAIERPFNKEQFKRLLTFLKPYKGRIAFALCLMVISAICSLALPMLMSKAIDQIDAGNAHNFPFFLIAMVICAAGGSICVRYRARIMDTAGRSAIADMRQTLFDHIQDLSFNFFDSRSAGKIMVRVINDVNSLNDLFTNGIVNVFIDCVTLVLLLTLMLVLGWVESLFPPLLGVPGIKLGLSNGVLIFAVYMLSLPTAWVLMLLKVVLSSLFLGGVAALPYALAGGVLSLASMCLLSRMKWMHPVTVSIVGGVMHNVGQIVMAMIILHTSQLAYYMAVLMLSGILFGALTGVSATLVMKHMKHIKWGK